MSISKLIQWLFTFLLLGSLAACGGGSESSSLLAGTPEEVNPGGGTTTPSTPDEPKDVSVQLSGPRIIPTGGKTLLTLTTFTDSSVQPEGAEETQLVLEPNVTFTATVTGDAQFENGQAVMDFTTDNRGQLQFLVQHPSKGNVLLSLQGRGDYQGGFTDTLYFGGTVSAQVLTSGLVPADGETPARITASAYDYNGLPISGVSTVFSLSPNSAAELASETFSLSGTTNAQGQFTTQLTNQVAQSISIMAIVGGIVADLLQVSFGSVDTELNLKASATLVTQGLVPADGESGAEILVLARDTNGIPLEGLEVSLSFPSDSFAVATKATGTTDEGGRFSTSITNTVAQTTTVTPIVSGVQANTLTLRFGTAATTSQPSRIDLVVTSPNNVLANGASTAALMATVRDQGGAPIPNVPLKIKSSSSNTMLLLHDGNSFAVRGTSFLLGETDEAGNLTFRVANMTAETVDISAEMTVDGEELTSGAQGIVFVEEPEVEPPEPGEPPDEIKVDSVTLTVENDSQPANGRDAVTLSGQVTVTNQDGESQPAGGRQVSFVVSGGQANIIPQNNGETYLDGRFFATVTDRQAESFTVRAVVSDYSSEPVLVTFTAITPDDQVANPTPPGSVTLIPSPKTQLADGSSEISLKVNVRDSGNTPMEGVQVTISSSSSSLIFDKGTELTNAGGTATFKLTNTQIERVNLYATAQALNANEVAVGAAQTGQTAIEFIAGQEVTRLEGRVTPSEILADGEAKGNITFTAYNAKGFPVEGVPIVLVMGDTTAVISTMRGETDANGRFTTEITSTQPGTVTVTGQVETGSTSANVAINFSTPGVEVVRLEGSVNPGNVLADGTSTGSITFTAYNAKNFPIEGIPIVLTVDKNTAQLATVRGQTDANGRFTTEIGSNQPGNVVVTAQVETASISANVSVNFFTRGSNVARLEPTINKAQALANGEDQIIYTVFATDDGGRPVADVPLNIIVDGANTVKLSQASGATGENGIFEVEITANSVGSVIISAEVPPDGVPRTNEPQVIEFVTAPADTVPTSLSLETVEGIREQPADGSSPIILIAKPLDVTGTPIPDVEIEFISDDPRFTVEKGTSNALGELRVPITQSEPANFVVTAVARVNDIVVRSDPMTLSFVAEDTSPLLPSINPLAFQAPVNEPIEVVVTVRHAQTNVPLQDVSVAFAFTVPADSGAKPRFTSAASGVTGEAGTFSTNVTSSQAGEVELWATVGNQNETEHVFLSFEKDSDTQVPVGELTLFSDNQQLASEGKSEGIIISARVKDEDNNLLVGKKVNFQVNSGDIQLVTKTLEAGTAIFAPGDSDGITDNSGQAYARLTTVGNKLNRTITVTATSEGKSDQMTVQVTGTKVTISGPNSLVLNLNDPLQNVVTLDLGLLDSADRGIAGQQLQVNLDSNIIIDNPSPVTNTNGQAEVNLTLSPTNVGTHTIEATLAGNPEGATSASHKLTVSDENFTLTYNGTASADGSIEIPLDGSGGGGTTPPDSGSNPCPVPIQGCDPNDSTDPGTGGTTSDTFTVKWMQGSTPKTGEFINISSTRGTPVNINPSDQRLDGNGELTFAMTSESVGEALISATSQTGASANIRVEFVAVSAQRIDVQASSPVLNTNAPGEDSQQTEIIAVVRDNNGNLVKNKQVNFNLTDVTGGYLTQSSATTNSSGRASTTYVAGTNSSAAGGVVIVGRLVPSHSDDAQNASDTVALTVAQKSLFIDVASGNELVDEGGRRYESLHTVLVTDSNGTPVNNAEVNLSIYATRYGKGTTESSISCPNEDINRNGILDAGEDTNGNGRLDPGTPITVAPGRITTGEGDQTPSGYGDFRVLYAVQYAHWVEAEIMARTVVEGSETVSTVPFVAVCSKPDADEEICPDSISPFGIVEDCSNPN